MFRTELKGEEEFKRAMRKLVDSTNGQVLVNSTEAGAFVIEGAAKINAPVLTGQLRNSIHSEVVSVTRNKVEVDVEPDTEYDIFVEYGTIHTRAHPYMRPAYDLKQNAAIKAFSDTMKAAVAMVGK